MSTEDPAATYRAAESHLNTARKHYEKTIKELLAGKAGEHYVISRVKTARSLIRKLREDPATPRSWESITDKVGARVICTTKADCEAAAELIQAGPWALKRYDKKKETKKNRLFYPGIHIEIEAPGIVDHAGAPVWCEVQIRTRAQDAWAVASHKLTYKGVVTPPRKMRRLIDRLTIFVEVFDDEIHRLFKKREKLPMYAQGLALEHLETKFEEISGDPAEVAKDLSIMSILMGAYDEAEFARFNELIDDFCAKRTDLAELVREHGYRSESYDDRHDWLYTQPEVLMVLERATNKKYKLAHVVAPTDLAGVVRSTCIAAGLTLPE
jgi:ppGpp synthetase/RelA/SpoT-type nucleotidyltranferase